MTTTTRRLPSTAATVRYATAATGWVVVSTAALVNVPDVHGFAAWLLLADFAATCAAAGWLSWPFFTALTVKEPR